MTSCPCLAASIPPTVPRHDMTVAFGAKPPSRISSRLVLAKEEIKQTLVFEDGRSMDYSEHTQFALRSTELPTAAAPAAGQH